MIIKDIEDLRRTNDEWQYRPQPLTDYQINLDYSRKSHKSLDARLYTALKRS